MPEERTDESYCKYLPIPEKFWYKPEVNPEIREECLREKQRHELSKSYALYAVRVVFRQRYGKASPFLREVADAICGEGYFKALEKYDPEQGAEFTTFLFSIYFNMARNERRRFLSQFIGFKHLFKVAVENCGNIGDSAETQGKRYLHFTLDFSGYDHFALPCGFRLPIHRMLFCDKVPDDDDSIPRRKLEIDPIQVHREFLKKVGNISKEEIQSIKRWRLPKLYRQKTDKALKQALSRLDTRIVDLLINPHLFRQTPKALIQKKLGITRYFYESRIKAILERLNIPSETSERRKEMRKLSHQKQSCAKKIVNLAKEARGNLEKRKVLYALYDGIFQWAENTDEFHDFASSERTAPHLEQDENDLIALWLDQPDLVDERETHQEWSDLDDEFDNE